MKLLGMKKIFLFVLLLSAGIGVMAAQDKEDGKREKMFREVQEFKMKYLAQEMDLSELQKKKFFEVYEEMEQSKRNCYKEATQADRKLKKDKEATEADYQQVTAAYTKANSEWANQEKQFNEKFSEFLSQKQIYKMKEAENSFKAKLDEMRHSRKKDHHKSEKK